MKDVKNCGKTDKGPTKLNALLNYPVTEEQTRTMFNLISDRFINKMELQIVKPIKTIFIRFSSRGFNLAKSVYALEMYQHENSHTATRANCQKIIDSC